MKAFHTIAIPHKDILEGRLTLDVFAADLWEVTQKRGPEEYKDPETFFRKTYLTEGLKNLLEIVKKRLAGKGGDPVIQIQTPFGGGKTHSLIAMYHKADEWKASKFIAVGTALSTDKTLWGLMEEQLTGKITNFTGKVAPGREAIRELLYKKQPVIILMDEVLEYVTKAAGVKVEQSNLAAQTIAFMQELTETAGTLEKICLVVTLPASIIEHYDEKSEKLFQQLQKVAGRVEKIYTPVQEQEITKIIRQRLFQDIEENASKKTVSSFISYAERENIFPAGTEQTQYRDRFIDSYPFMPEVIDILYHRWGSFPTFQRTRGVLRLLSLVIHSLSKSKSPYISLSDFNLDIQDIRQELLKHIGAEYNSVIASDITAFEAGAKKIDMSLGDTNKGLSLGTRAATTIFLYSFSGGHETGATLGEIKRSSTTMDNPASVVAEATEQLKNKLFYMQNSGEKYFFSNQPNLNRIVLTKMDNVKDYELVDMEQRLLKQSIKGDKLKVYIWEEKAGNIPDTEDLKLLILKKDNPDVMKDILQNKGHTPRVYRNTLFFLYPLETERTGFYNLLKRKIAYENINQDKNLKLSTEQKEEVKNKLKECEADIKESVRRLYRIIAIPIKEGFKDDDLGIPTYGIQKKLDEEVYDQLHSNGEILEMIASLVIKERYLKGKDYVLTDQLYQATIKTPGETRFSSRTVLAKGIGDGVVKGLFGLGELEDDKPVCRYYKEFPEQLFSSNEVIIREELCIVPPSPVAGEKTSPLAPYDGQVLCYMPVTPSITLPKEPITGISDGVMDNVNLKFTIPKGKVSNIMGIMNLLQLKFDVLEIEINAKKGAIKTQEYEDKILEAFNQLGIKVNLLNLQI